MSTDKPTRYKTRQLFDMGEPLPFFELWTATTPQEDGQFIGRIFDKQHAQRIIEGLFPVSLDAHGVYRVGSTRVTLQTVVYAYRDGDSPEFIQACYPVLSLADIYAAVAYYLQNKEAVDAYLVEREKHQAELREQASPSPPRASLEARRSTSESEP